MRAAVFDAPFKIRMTELEKPVPGIGEVLVRVDAVGLCAGDLYIFLGKNPYVTFPRVGGHEIAGIVEARGSDVQSVALGTSVVVDPFIGCGACYACRVNKPNCCANLQIIGVHHDGGFADYVIVPQNKLVPVPAGLSPYDASFAEPVGIAVQACRRGLVTDADTVLVLGAGPIGLALVEVARARGAQVYVADISVDRLATAEQLGGQPLEGGDALIDKVMHLTKGEGMPVVIEATGSVSAIEQTFDLVASGGRIVIVGLVKKGVPVSFPGLDITRKEVTVLGSRASNHCLAESLELIASGKIKYPGIGERFDLKHAPEIFAELQSNPAAFHKAVFCS
jgi:L-gulonate 5-dehydrogenase